MTDPTPRKNEAEALLESKEHYQQLFNHSNDGVVIHSLEGDILDVNQTAVVQLGYSREELLALPVSALHPPEDLGICKDAVARVVHQSEVRFEIRFRRKDGSLFPAEVSSSVLQIGDRSVAQAIIRDISERKRTEARLNLVVEATSAVTGADYFRVAARSVASLLEVRYACISRIHPSKPGYGQILALWNGKGFENLQEYAVPGTPCAEIRSRKVACFPSGVQEAFPQDEWLRVNGMESYLGIGLTDSAGRHIGNLMVMNDRPMDPKIPSEPLLQIVAARASAELERLIAEEERNRLEGRLREAQKLKSLGLLAGGIAHDFNNLLLTILGNTDLALADLPADSPVREFLEDVDKAARDGAALTAQLLSYAGKNLLLSKKFDLSELIQDMARLLEAVIPPNITIHRELAGGLPGIQGDAAQIRQVIMNLVTNASEAIGEKEGEILVKTGIFHAAAGRLAGTLLGADLPEGDYVCLQVSDDGCGMDAGTRSKIFDPFFTTKFTGRGLGLASLLGIVRGHQGTLEVESAPQKGTTFRVFFPAAGSGSRDTLGTQELRSLGMRKGTILVVDDEKSARLVARRMLEKHGFQILEAADGVEGVEVFRRNANAISAVLLDLTMPRLNGEETMQEMRRIQAGMRVLFTSGFAEADPAAWLEAGPLSGFIQKPFSSPTLLQALDRLLEAGPVPAG
ncbi:MAG: PAS domain S-box protein [Planctomycetota bacterium]